MVAAQVIGNDATITIAGQSGNFQLNVMLPVVAYNLIQSIDILATAATQLADQAIAGFVVKRGKPDRRAGPQPDPGDGNERRHRLRQGRGDREESLRRGAARSATSPGK